MLILNINVHYESIISVWYSVSSLAWFMSNQETSFVTIGQRLLANPLRYDLPLLFLHLVNYLMSDIFGCLTMLTLLVSFI